LYVHIHCTECGLYRCGLPEELDVYACPICGRASKAAIIAEGYSKHAVPLEPVLIVKALSLKARQMLMAGEKVRKPRREVDRHHKQKIRRSTLAAAL